MRKITFIAILLSGCTFYQQSENTIQTSQVPMGPGNEMEVHFLNVGQGDSILVQSPNGNLLVDGGIKGNSISTNTRKMKPRASKFID